MSEGTEERDAVILIVDDEDYNVDYLQQNLSDLGFRTREAYGGREALDSINKEAPDLILLDVMMPDIDGITVCQILKRDPITQLIPIVIMTALDGQEDRIRGIEAGADDFLTKPVDELELIARIDSLLRAKRAVDRTAGELKSAASQLKELGTREEEVTVLAVELRSGDLVGEDTADAVYDYFRGRYVEAIVAAIEQRHGEIVSSNDDRMLAIMRSGTKSGDSRDAIDAALAIRSEFQAMNRRNDIQHLSVVSAIDYGDVAINPERVDEQGASHWTTLVTGVVMNQAVALAAQADSGDVVVSDSAFEGVRGQYAYETLELRDPALKMLRAAQIVGISEGAHPDYDGSEPIAAPTRQLETIFISDIVGSTEIATQLGDRAWADKLDDHYQLVRNNLDHFDGEEISTAGDGFLVLFSAPANAILAGFSICDHSGSIGLPVRVGIHTGEVERLEHDVQGIAVHLAARVSAEAGDSQVLVTSTTKEAVAGSDLRFVSEGTRSLKGIEGDREVFLAIRD